MRRWTAMLARHAASASKQAARASQEACFVASRRASTTASCRSSLTRPEFHSAPAPGRSFRPSRRSYHSRWAISVYGKEPGAPKKEYEGYEKEMVAFKRKGLAFEDAMVNDDPLLGPSSDAAPSATEKQTSVSDHLGNIEKRWDEEEDDEEEDEEEDFAFEKDGDDEDDDWLHGDGVDVAKAETNENLGLSVAEGTPTDPESLPAGLYLVGTPIGNLEDITLRALRVLRSADAILCEDTRHTRRLLDRYGVARKRLISYHCHNERRKRDGLVEKIKAGFSLALVSDAGTPSVADPGADLCAACADVCLPIFPIPGPCAPASAIVAAGAITPGEDGFSFIGFLPPKTGARRRRWQKFANAPGSLVAFVPPHKLVGVLEDAVLELGEARKCVVCREMTKVHEEFWRGTLREAVQEFSNRKPRGEITLVVAGVGPHGGFSAERGEARDASGGGGETPWRNLSGEALEAKIRVWIEEEGVSPSDASKRAAREFGARKKEAYATALRVAGKHD